MTRKSKQAGGNMPLTAFEKKKYSVGYGTTSARLNGISQHQFGMCCLSLKIASEHPIASATSGHIYEKEAILEHILVKTKELKKAKLDYENHEKKRKTQQLEMDEKKRKAEVVAFEESQKVVSGKKRRMEDNPLRRTSYWLAEFQPEKSNNRNESLEIPPKRPPSPNSLKPLSKKDLVPLKLRRNTENHVICGVSERPIKNQQAIALVTTKGTPAEVVLEKVFKDLGSEKCCPITGRKIAKILRLQKGGSSFAASGASVAKTYRPTMT